MIQIIKDEKYQYFYFFWIFYTTQKFIYFEWLLHNIQVYIYYYGRGGCGKSEISLEKFEKFCRAKQAADRIRKFVKSEESLEEQEKYI